MKIAFIDVLGLRYDGSTAEKRGLGGSESAVIYMAEELHKLGFSVTVYNNCKGDNSHPGVYNGVEYIDNGDYYKFEDFYDIVICSRSVIPFMPGSVYKFIENSTHKVLWMHDTFCEGDENLEYLLVNGIINEVFVLSDFHLTYVTTNEHGNKRMYEVLKNKVWITRNGVKRRFFDDYLIEKKQKNKFVYNASVTKGLVPLLEDIWPEIKRRIPDARLVCIGGYYDLLNGEFNEQKEKLLKYSSDDRYKDLDIEFTGIITQKQVAEIVATSGFMIYPAEFPETFGISTLESLLYNTPVITNNFGALEQTAIDIACYKIDYPVVPNSLFPFINKDVQVQRFIKLVEQAYNDDYLYQQKQHACDVIKDICEWSTVALQWKQHFFSVFKKMLPLDDYNKVTRINQKVLRVFNQKNINKEHHIFPSFGDEKRIVIISPFRNAEKYIKDHIESVAGQNYGNYLHVIIDDFSDDNSINIIHEFLSGLKNDLRDKFIIIENEFRKGAIRNQLSVIKKYIQEDDIVMLLDGDDCLINDNEIFNFYNDLYNQGYDFTYGSMWSKADNIPLIAQEYLSDRTYNWSIPYTHLRTMKGSVALMVNESNYIKDNGEWMMAGADNPLFRETFSYASNPYAVKEITVIYNDENDNNDYKINSIEQTENSKKQIQINEKLNNSNVDMNILENQNNCFNIERNKTILIAVPTNKYVETETMKSIYDLEVPEGYTTRLEFFYGYQIDQIRNLIAEWAKNFDYLFSVDSDISFDRGTLKRLLSHGVDIVSGLYIQRIHDENNLEIYSCGSNLKYEQVKNKGLIEVDSCGFGCVLVSNKVINSMDYPHFYYKSAIDHNDTISEDTFFCNKARSKGFKVYADTGLLCDHKGSHMFKVK